MILAKIFWERIKNEFTLTEKLELSNAYLTESICPQGVILDEEKLTPETKAKLKEFRTMPYAHLMEYLKHKN